MPRTWQYDERTGMVAVYAGEPRNCLDLPSDSFIFVRRWERKHDGDGFEQVEEDKRIGHLVSAAPDMLAALKALLEYAEWVGTPRGYSWGESGEKPCSMARAAIAKAEAVVNR